MFTPWNAKSIPLGQRIFHRGDVLDFCNVRDNRGQVVLMVTSFGEVLVNNAYVHAKQYISQARSARTSPYAPCVLTATDMSDISKVLKVDDIFIFWMDI